jgi:hypothetical protein
VLRKLGRVAAIGGVLGLTLVATQAYASVLWDGDAGKGTGVFGNSNCGSPGSITAVTDPARGTVWRFNKPAGDKRCEAHGIKVGDNKYNFQNNSTYYIAWSMKLSSTVDNNANFQWKSYGHHIQNYPIVLKVRGGKLTLLNRQPGGRDYYPWSAAVSANAWNDIVLGIHTSSALTGGWVELYVNGVQQTFSNGQQRWPCRTWDGINDPKWGVYGATQTAVANYVDGLKIGATYADIH